MIKKITLLICLINIFTCLSQSDFHIPIDTFNIAYREKLKSLYNERAVQTRLSFKTIHDRDLRNALTESYIELNSEFINKVNTGLFVQASFYEEQINRLFQEIVKANPQYTTLGSTKILLSFADAPNAFAMGDGLVVVYLPLLAKLKNENELAFILCHEIAHNLLDHPEEGLLEYARVKSSSQIKKQTRDIEKKKYNKTADASSLYRKIIYTNRKKHREVEFQADSLGFILYRNAFAGREAIALKSFTTLEDMDMEKDSLQPDDYQRIFSSDKQPFKKEWLMGDEISMYRYDKTIKFWQVDSLKTHPDCRDRANRLKTLFSIDTENENLISADYANTITRAEYDHVLGLYMLKEYGKSLYQTLLLLKESSGDAYLRSMVYNNLTKIQQAQKAYTMNKYVEIMNPRYSYSYNTFLSFIRQLRKSEMNEIINQYSTKI